MSYIEQTKAWIEKIVIGLNLCPFAGNPFYNQQIRYVLSEAKTTEQLVKDLIEELLHLTETPPDQLETTLIIHPHVLQSFHDYYHFGATTQLILEELNFAGIYQIAEFHPEFRFSGTQPDDAQNYTNRSPYPMLHILREDSVEMAIRSHPDPAAIPKENIKTMEALGRDRILAILAEITGSSDWP